jgi:hypothetical protein
VVLPSRATIPDGWSARQRRRFRQTAPMPHGGRKRQPKSEIVVVSALKDWSCAECSGGGSLLTMGDKGPLCLGCADLAHLVFLPAGDAALTRRARRASGLSAAVVRFSRARKRYERQGILVEEEPLERAEAECLADAEARARRRERERSRRAGHDFAFQAEMAKEIVRLFPGCPRDRAEEVARHTGVRGSGRVGRSAAGRAFDPGALELAVAASIRHRDTGYDELLMSGIERAEARHLVRGDVGRMLDEWRSPG